MDSEVAPGILRLQGCEWVWYGAGSSVLCLHCAPDFADLGRADSGSGRDVVVWCPSCSFGCCIEYSLHFRRQDLAMVDELSGECSGHRYVASGKPSRAG